MDGYLGEVRLIAYNFAPRNWMRCEGQILQITQYSALFALIGNLYGGNGTSNFALPDLRGRIPLGAGTPPAPRTAVQLASYGGTDKVTLTATQTPLAPHTHPATFTAGGGTPVSVTASVPVSTIVPTVGPALTNGQPAYLANAAVGANLKGLYSATPPAEGSTATIPVPTVVSGGSSGGTVTVNANAATAASPVTVLNPYQALYYCICVAGMFPSRS